MRKEKDASVKSGLARRISIFGKSPLPRSPWSLNFKAPKANDGTWLDAGRRFRK